MSKSCLKCRYVKGCGYYKPCNNFEHYKESEELKVEELHFKTGARSGKIASTIDKPLHSYLKRTLEVQTMEEVAELSQAISKVYRFGLNEDRKLNLVEEIADTYIMIDMIIDRYGLSRADISNNVLYKANRLKKRIIEDIKETGGSL